VVCALYLHLIYSISVFFNIKNVKHSTLYDGFSLSPYKDKDAILDKGSNRCDMRFQMLLLYCM
jgi:hypothetical protein